MTARMQAATQEASAHRLAHVGPLMAQRTCVSAMTDMDYGFQHEGNN